MVVWGGFRGGLGLVYGVFAQNVSLGPWALDSLGFVAYEEAGGLQEDKSQKPRS